MHANDLAELDSVNTGMPLAQRQMIVPTCGEFFRYYARWCTKVNGTAH
jgi:acyl-CoA reductase-like NAD-dependent aldehyde dehydrogenase